MDSAVGGICNITSATFNFNIIDVELMKPMQHASIVDNTSHLDNEIVMVGLGTLRASRWTAFAFVLPLYRQSIFMWTGIIFTGERVGAVIAAVAYALVQSLGSLVLVEWAVTLLAD